MFRTFLRHPAGPCLLVFCLLLATAALGQGQGLGRASGRVIGPAGQGREGVAVVDAAGRFATLSDASGHFVLDKLPLGSYTLLTRSLGYGEGRQPISRSAAQPSATVDFWLAASPNAVQEAEVLEASPSPMRPSTRVACGPSTPLARLPSAAWAWPWAATS